jgi:hypothetical protein
MSMYAARMGDLVFKCLLAAGSFLLALAAMSARAQETDSARALADRYKAMAGELQASPFGKPLVLHSQESGQGVSGEVYAVVDHPFEAVRTALDGAPRWCDVLLLHLNTKHCYAAGKARDAVLSMHVGKKYDQPLEDSFRLDFHYLMDAGKPDYLRARLDAKEGPMGTRDYRIVVEATPVDAKRTFLHFSYSYGYGMSARFALGAYLNTVGREKVGFSRGRDNQYVGGMRGLVERNTMRYYLAIEATLDAQSSPVETRFDKRLHNWFAASERYARQLHELSESEYVEMKHKEYRRLQAQS